MADSQTTSQMMSALSHAPAPQDLKRKRSLSLESMHPASAPLPKSAKTHNHLQINYLARHCDKDLPLINNEDPMPNLLALLTDYQGVLDRHESMACNLGGRPLGPILIKRFERLFDGPPKVVKNHGKEGTTVSWLDVVEFARNKPEQFHLGQKSEGARVCQFYTKQCRVQISEEDFQLISSGIPQQMIPPQPIAADEDKELGTLEILERSLGLISQLADQVAARARQVNHRIKGRKQAILDRRATASPASPVRPPSPSNVALMNGVPAQIPNIAVMAQSSHSSPGGFVAVNSRPHHDQNGNASSQNTRHDLMSKFHSLSDRRASSQPSASDARRPSLGQVPPSHPATPLNPSKPPPVDPAPTSLARPSSYTDAELQHLMVSPVPIPRTPPSLIPPTSQRANQAQEKDDGGPFKAEMVHRMETLAKGDRILPPCDRCRRLHMDCLKNLTACMGCTKKHAKCSWKEVRESELRGGFSHHNHIDVRGGMHSDGEDGESHERASTGSPGAAMSPPHLGPQHPYMSDSRGMPSRISMDRDRDRAVEAQLQEAARSGLAHANARLGTSDGKGAEYQTLVA